MGSTSVASVAASGVLLAASGVVCDSSLFSLEIAVSTKLLTSDGARTKTSVSLRGALVCMSRRDILVCPGDVILCRRSCAEPGSGLFAAHFPPHDVTFSINRWCQVPPCGGN